MLWVFKDSDSLAKSARRTGTEEEGARYIIVDVLLAPPETARWETSQIRALFDTGCGLPVVISRQMANRLGIEPTGKSNVTLGNGHPVAADEATIDIRLAGLALLNVKCQVVDGLDGVLDTGVVLGVPLLDLFNLHVDGGQVSLTPNYEAVAKLLRRWEPTPKDRAAPKGAMFYFPGET